MTDTQTTATAEPDTTPAASGTLIRVKIAKANASIEVSWDDLSPEVKMYIVEQGLAKLLNGATAKETKTQTPDDKQRAANALSLANKKLDALKKGEFKRTRASGKVPGAVMTEARRIAKNIVKAGIKANGEKVSDYDAKSITEMANQYIEENPDVVTQAQTAIENAAKLAAATKVDTSKFAPNPAKKAKREAANAAKRAETAEKNAGKPGPQRSAIATRAKPAVVRGAKPSQPQAHH